MEKIRARNQFNRDAVERKAKSRRRTSLRKISQNDTLSDIISTAIDHGEINLSPNAKGKESPKEAARLSKLEMHALKKCHASKGN